MTDTPISFDDAPAPTSGASCSRCHRSLSSYWSLDGAVLCESCAQALREERTSGDGAVGRVGKAFGLGVGGMLVGAAVWYAVARATGWEIGYIAILLGWLVGKGIHRGSEKRGGLGYQVMAIVLTYLGIGIAKVPFEIQAQIEAGRQSFDSVAVAESAPRTESEARAQLAELDSSLAAGKELEDDAQGGILGLASAFGAVILLALMIPFHSIIGGQSVIGILIYGFAIWQAWKVAARTDPVLSGPHPVAGAPS